MAIEQLKKTWTAPKLVIVRPMAQAQMNVNISGTDYLSVPGYGDIPFMQS